MSEEVVLQFSAAQEEDLTLQWWFHCLLLCHLSLLLLGYLQVLVLKLNMNFITTLVLLVELIYGSSLPNFLNSFQFYRFFAREAPVA